MGQQSTIESTIVLGDGYDDLDLQLAEECGSFYADPLGWVLWAFDWDMDDLKGFLGPDKWQADVLNEIGAEVVERCFDGVNPVDAIREAVASGHGIGKSALTAWLILWIMSTRPDAKGTVTANTGDQLRTKTWAELGKWRKKCIVGHWFEYNNGKGSMSLYHRDYPETWRCDGQTCREENSESFAGQHTAGSTSFYIFDEASAVPDDIWEVAEGGLSKGEPMIFCFGNPTRNNGKFRECFTKFRKLWNTRQIDSRDAARANTSQIKKWADMYGDDSDFFRVRVKGQFPRGGDMQFITGDIVENARNNSPRYLGDDPLVCGMDWARGGDDDCRIVFRRGKDARSEKNYRIAGEHSRNSMEVAGKVSRVLNMHKPDVCFGDVGSMGGPINDRLRQLGHNVIDVGFGMDAEEKDKYTTRAAEMWQRMADWLRADGSMPDDNDLDEELTGRLYDHDDKGRLILERKKDMKKRLGRSPDFADALCLTFASVVPKKEIPRGDDDKPLGQRGTTGKDYDPLDAMD